MECEFRTNRFEPAPMKPLQPLAFAPFGKARFNDCLARPLCGARLRMVH